MDGRPDIGDAVLLRGLYRRHVRWAFPHRVAGFEGEWVALYCCPGTEGRTLGRNDDGTAAVERWLRGDPAGPWIWQDTNVLRLVRPGRPYTVEVWWDERWNHTRWYINLQAPTVRTALGYDTSDWALDVVVAPGGQWEWKDEDDLAELVAHGVFTPDEALRVRGVGEHVIADRPWPTGWETWRPPAGWRPPPLPAGWDIVEHEIPGIEAVADPREWAV